MIQCNMGIPWESPTIVYIKKLIILEYNQGEMRGTLQGVLATLPLQPDSYMPLGWKKWHPPIICWFKWVHVNIWRSRKFLFKIYLISNLLWSTGIIYVLLQARNAPCPKRTALGANSRRHNITLYFHPVFGLVDLLRRLTSPASSFPGGVPPFFWFYLINQWFYIANRGAVFGCGFEALISI